VGYSVYLFYLFFCDYLVRGIIFRIFIVLVNQKTIIMNKNMELISNQAAGLDLIIDKDAGNPIRILTGKHSIEVFEQLRDICDEAINELQAKTK